MLFGEMSIQVLCSFLNWAYLSFYYWFVTVICIFKSLIKYRIWKYLLPFHIFFYFLDGVHWSIKVLNFDEVKFIIFSFATHIFGFISKKTLSNLRSCIFAPMFSPKSCIVFVLASKCSFRFELIFVYGVKNPTSFFCMWLSSCPSTLCWKDDSLPAHWSWHCCWRPADHTCTGYLWTLNSIPLVCASILVPVPRCCYCCFAVKFEIVKC